MAVPTLESAIPHRDEDPTMLLRARALADAKRLRALARVALRDGAPKASLRAANARAAARSVLRHARTLSHLALTAEPLSR